MIPKKQQKKIAKERINILFEQLKKTKDITLKNRYITLARKLSMKYNVPIEKNHKKLFCKNCYKVLIPGKTLRTRLKNKRLSYFCTNCNHITRYPLKKSKTAS